MNQQPDKFFRDKLQGYQKAPPSDVWKSISQNVKPKNTFVWLKVAASVLLFTSAGILIFSSERSPREVISNNAGTPDSLRGAPLNEMLPDQNQLLKEAEQQAITSPAATARKVHKSKKSTKRQNSTPTREEVPTLEQEVSFFAVVENETLKTPEGDTAEASALLSANQKRRIKIVFSAEEVNKKYLNKDGLGHATADEKQASTLKKLLDKAHDLKYNQDPLGDLRQKKNEILALNLKSDRQRNTND